MIEQAKAVAQRLREHDLHYSDQESAASAIDALVAEVEDVTSMYNRCVEDVHALREEAEQYKSDWKACTAMNRELLAEVERLKQEQAEPVIIDRGCFERGCACFDSRVDNDGVKVYEQRK